MKGEFGKEGLFKKADVLVYLIVALVIAAIALAVFLPKKPSILSADIYSDGTLVYTYSFTEGKGRTTEAGKEIVTEARDGAITFVTVVGKKGKNVVEIGDGYIKMADSDCINRDCVNKFSPLTRGGGTIVCLPNGVKIVSSGEISDEVKL